MTPTPTLRLSGDSEADRLLSEDPLALLVGMVLDQQVPLEWAFSAPVRLKERLGGKLDVGVIASMDTDALSAVFAARPALHRFPGSMARRVQDLCQLLIDLYDGKADHVWADPESGEEMLRRLRQLPGFGEHKAKIFLALLGKQLGVKPAGWVEASDPFGSPGSFRSIADITSNETLVRVRAYKAEMKAASKAAGKER